LLPLERQAERLRAGWGATKLNEEHAKGPDLDASVAQRSLGVIRVKPLSASTLRLDGRETMTNEIESVW
jgi:hypothetical protein